MPALNVDATISISAPIARVSEVLVDFNTWPTWNPWLYTEKEALVTVEGEPGVSGHRYDWSGEKVGAGEMTLLSHNDVRIDYDLLFKKPYKSKAKIAFDLQPVSDIETQVTWQMRSRLPFFMFWMRDKMVGMILSDFNRGLALLKDYIEKGATHSNTTLVGIVDVDASFYIAHSGTTAMASISQALDESFEELKSASSNGRLAVTGAPFVIYDQMDMKTQSCQYTAAYPTDSIQNVVHPIVSDERPACRALKAIHTGPYHHLGSAWATVMTEIRDRKEKPRKNVNPFEIYLNDPEAIEANDLITELYFPIRG